MVKTIQRYLIRSFLLLLISTPLVYAQNSCSYTSKPFSGYFDLPKQIVTDASGNIWVQNTGEDKSIVKISAGNSGSPTFYDGAKYQFSSPYLLAVDNKGNLWILSEWLKKVTKLPAENPEAVVTIPLKQAKLPSSIVADNNGDIWVADRGGNSLIRLLANAPDKQTVFSGSKYQFDAYSLSGKGIAADSKGNIWVGGAQKVTLLPDSIPRVPYIFAGASYGFPSHVGGITIDKQNNIYVLNHQSNSVTKIPSSDPEANPIIYSGSALRLDQTTGITVDPKGNIWVASASENTLTEIPAQYPSGTTPIIYNGVDHGFGFIGDLVADVNGNIWVSDTANNRVIKLELNAGSC